MKKIGIAGSILLDVVKRIDVWPDKGMLVNIVDISRAVGGCVCNTGTDLKLLEEDIRVSVYGRIGKDEYGDFVLGFMKEKGLDVKGIGRSEKAPTSFTDVMTVAATGERTFFNMRGANAEFTEKDICPASLDCELFHLGYLLLLDGMDETDCEYGTKAARLLHDVQAQGIKTSIDLVSEQSDRFEKIVTPALKYCDYVVINEVEGGRLSGISATDENGRLSLGNLEKICRRLLELGVGECAVVHCPELSCSANAKGQFTVVPSLELPKGYIVGSVGAGDAFCAGMLYAFLHGMTEEEGMKLASCAAACNLSVADSVSGARNLAKTLELENKYKRRKIKC